MTTLQFQVEEATLRDAIACAEAAAFRRQSCPTRPEIPAPEDAAAHLAGLRLRLARLLADRDT